MDSSLLLSLRHSLSHSSSGDDEDGLHQDGGLDDGGLDDGDHDEDDLEEDGHDNGSSKIRIVVLSGRIGTPIMPTHHSSSTMSFH